MRRFIIILFVLFSAVVRAEGPGVVVVTGGTLGIGYELVSLLYKKGWKVATVARNADRVQQMKSVFPDPERFYAEPVSVGDFGGMRHFMDNVEKKFGPVTAVVNNAGLTGQLLRLGELNASEIADIVTTNYTGTVNLTADAVARMTKNGIKGTIINVSSGSAKGVPGLATYSGAKAAVNAFTTAVAQEYEGFGIRLFAFNPGHVDTRLQTGVRSADPEVFPSASTFVDFFKNDELVTTAHSAEHIEFLLEYPLSFNSGSLVTYSDVATRMTAGGCNIHHYKYMLLKGK